jgi:hypothetical protein
MSHSVHHPPAPTPGRSTITLSPRHPHFFDVVLAPLASRCAAGEDRGALSLELYQTIHPWAVSEARRRAIGLPSHADRDELLSHVLRLSWEACERLDWDRVESWLGFLDSKVSRARAEAARSDDWLSRRERVRRRSFQREVAMREQRQGRSLTSDERDAVAVSVAPGSGRVNWAAAVLAGRHPSTVAEVPDTIDVSGVEDQVEQRTIDEIRGRCVAEWLQLVAAQNGQLADELSCWSASHESAERALPARLAYKVEPYTPMLLAMLAEAA